MSIICSQDQHSDSIRQLERLQNEVSAIALSRSRENGIEGAAADAEGQEAEDERNAGDEKENEEEEEAVEGGGAAGGDRSGPMSVE